MSNAELDQYLRLLEAQQVADAELVVRMQAQQAAELDQYLRLLEAQQATDAELVVRMQDQSDTGPVRDD